MNILSPWIKGCADDGYNAIEPDNLDVSSLAPWSATRHSHSFQTYTRSDGLLTQDENIALATLIVSYAHSVGLAVAQKNTAELGDIGKSEVGFDFAVAEECQANSDSGYDECAIYGAAYGNEWLEVEYESAAFTAACAARNTSISIDLRNRDVTPKGVYEEC